MSLPFLKEPHLYIELKASTLLLNTNIGIKVQGPGGWVGLLGGGGCLRGEAHRLLGRGRRLLFEASNILEEPSKEQPVDTVPLETLPA